MESPASAAAVTSVHRAPRERVQQDTPREAASPTFACTRRQEAFDSSALGGSSTYLHAMGKLVVASEEWAKMSHSVNELAEKGNGRHHNGDVEGHREHVDKEEEPLYHEVHEAHHKHLEHNRK